MTRKRRRFDLVAVDLSIRQDPEGARRLAATLDALIAGFHARGVEVFVQEPGEAHCEEGDDGTGR